MRHVILTLALIAAGQAAGAFETEDHAVFGPPDAAGVVRIISTADIDYFEPTIRAYLADSPGYRIDYTVASSSEVMRALHDEGQAFDVAISSAMDLQTKLANDGLALRHFPKLKATLPEWSVWNDMVFAISQEPATIVVSTAAFGDIPVPTSRQDLITTLRRNPERFRGRIGTYDLRESGLGYLFATQDSRRSETYWRLTEVMGGLDVRLYCCSADMIEDVKSGRLAIAYNVLGSYAEEHLDTDKIRIVLPADFTTVMLRTALIPVTSENPDAAAGFIDFLLRQAYEDGDSSLSPSDLVLERNERSVHRIQLGPGLLVYLDQFKKNGFLQEWKNAMVQE